MTPKQIYEEALIFGLCLQFQIGYCLHLCTLSDLFCFSKLNEQEMYVHPQSIILGTKTRSMVKFTLTSNSPETPRIYIMDIFSGVDISPVSMLDHNIKSFEMTIISQMESSWNEL